MKFRTRTYRWRLRNVALGLAIAAIALPVAGQAVAQPAEPTGTQTSVVRPDDQANHGIGATVPTPTLPTLAELQQFSFDAPERTLPAGLTGDDGLKGVPTAVPTADLPVGLTGDDGKKGVPTAVPSAPQFVRPPVQPLFPVDAPRSGPASVDIPQQIPAPRVAPPVADAPGSPLIPATRVSTPSFDWSDAGVGIGIGLAIALTLTGALFLVGRRRDHKVLGV